MKAMRCNWASGEIIELLKEAEATQKGSVTTITTITTNKPSVIAKISEKDL